MESSSSNCLFVVEIDTSMHINVYTYEREYAVMGVTGRSDGVEGPGATAAMYAVGILILYGW
jgi:hypothetical protein